MSGPSLSTQPRLVRQLVTAVRANEVTAAGNYATRNGAAAILVTANGAGLTPFYVDPADFELYNRRLLFRLRAVWAVGDVNPAQTCRLALFAAAGVGGTATTQLLALGAELAGSSTPARALATPNVVEGPDASGDFEISAAGLYVPVVVTSGALAATSWIALDLNLSALTR